MFKYTGSKLFENGTLVSHRCTLWGRVKTNRRLAVEIAERNGMDPSRVSASIQLIPSSAYSRVNKAKTTMLQAAFKEYAIPWSAQVNNSGGGVESQGEYLVLAQDLYDFTQKISEARMLFEQACTEDVFRVWPDLVADGVRRLNLTHDQMLSLYPPLEEVKAKFTWELNIRPLWDVRDIQDDVRLKASSDLVNDAIGAAIKDQNQKVSNVVKDLVDEVVGMATEQSENMRSGESLPYAPTWEKLPTLASKLESWGSALSDNNPLIDAAYELRSLFDHVSDISGGDLNRTRNALSKDDGTLRNSVKERFDSIAHKASSALEDFLM